MSKYFNIKKAASVSTIYMYGDIGYEVASGQIAAELQPAPRRASV